jgi:isoaspartyl peptidase/L-asparaginase-like protein (Ntn-hydrolase superfamily)
VLVAHSGAGDYSKMTPQVIEARRDGMVKGIRVGYAVLARGGSSLDAVEATGYGGFHLARLMMEEAPQVLLVAAGAEKQKKAGERHGTVGVVALDTAGNQAAGTYADNDSCAVSATGTGEYFMRNVVASDICVRVRYLHVTLQQAANDVVRKELVAQNGDGSVIALDWQGNIATSFNTTGMLTGAVHQDGKIKMSGWSKSAQPIVVPAQ